MAGVFKKVSERGTGSSPQNAALQIKRGRGRPRPIPGRSLGLLVRIGRPGLAIARIGLCPQTRTFHSAAWCYSCYRL